MRQRPIKLKSIAGQEPAEKVMQNRVASSAASLPTFAPSPAPKIVARERTERVKRAVRSNATSDDTRHKISVAIQVCEKLERRALKHSTAANVDPAYLCKFMSKQAVAKFRELKLVGEERALEKTRSKLGGKIESFFQLKQKPKAAWHRAQIVLTNDQLQAVHLLCEDPLQVKTARACVNAVLYALLWEISVPRTDDTPLDEHC